MGKAQIGEEMRQRSNKGGTESKRKLRKQANEEGGGDMGGRREEAEREL